MVPASRIVVSAFIVYPTSTHSAEQQECAASPSCSCRIFRAASEQQQLRRKRGHGEIIICCRMRNTTKNHERRLSLFVLFRRPGEKRGRAGPAAARTGPRPAARLAAGRRSRFINVGAGQSLQPATGPIWRRWPTWKAWTGPWTSWRYSAGRPFIIIIIIIIVIVTTTAARRSPLAATELRLLYIPTALYALRPESGSTPGKQRQRARADGKQRRDALVRLLHEELLPIPMLQIAAVTLDLDDGSVKQPLRSSNRISQKNEPSASHQQQQQQQRPFPTTGRQALQEWNPHVVYVQGGNTFWLYHCLHKHDNTNWRDALQTLVQREDTLYCGASAGAILAGASLETACWKGWDDPRVVPGRETYDDWKNVPGLNWCGGRAFFPHYVEDEWGDTVRVKGTELVQRRHRDKSNAVAVQVEEVVSLRDDQVWHLDGASGQATIL